MPAFVVGCESNLRQLGILIILSSLRVISPPLFIARPLAGAGLILSAALATGRHRWWLGKLPAEFLPNLGKYHRQSSANHKVNSDSLPVLFVVVSQELP